MQVAHRTRAYPDFLRMKSPGVLHVQSGWDASPLHGHGYPQELNSPVPFYSTE